MVTRFILVPRNTSRKAKVINRFWSKVKIDHNDKCWIWKAGRHPDGYGRFGICFGYQVGAHRFSYTIHKGNPGKLLVLHKCDNPPCVNPRHLFLGTEKDNVRDRVNKLRTSNGDRHWTHLYPDKVKKGIENGNCRLSEKDIKLIRILHRNGFSKKRLAQAFKITRRHVRLIIIRKLWKHL